MQKGVKLVIAIGLLAVAGYIYHMKAINTKDVLVNSTKISLPTGEIGCIYDAKVEVSPEKNPASPLIFFVPANAKNKIELVRYEQKSTNSSGYGFRGTDGQIYEIEGKNLVMFIDTDKLQPKTQPKFITIKRSWNKDILTDEAALKKLAIQAFVQK